MDRALAACWRLVAVIGLVERTAGIALIAMIVVTITVQVVTRYAWGQPLVWVEEMATYGFIWSVFLGAAVGLKDVRHIRIETFLGRIPEAWRAALNAMLYAIVGICCVSLGRYAVEIMQIEARSETISLPINVGRHWFYSVPLFAGLASMALTAGYFVAAYLAKAIVGRPVDAEVDSEARRLRDLAEDEADIRVAEGSL